jgi:hypothetical protein
VALTLAEQLVENSKSNLKRVEIYSPPVEEETVIQEEDTDPTPG